MALVEPLCLQKLYEKDDDLKYFEDDIKLRHERFKNLFEEIEEKEPGGWDSFTSSYKYYGVNRVGEIIRILEWIPDVKAVFLVGDFNNWDKYAHPLKKHHFWHWNLDLSSEDSKKVTHLSKLKLLIQTDSAEFYRISPWSRYVLQNEKTKIFESVHYEPKNPYTWKYPWPLISQEDKNQCESLKIYECHVGISSEEPKVASYLHFKEKVIPHILYLGYNAIQLMAIQEHAFYGSFGYQVTSFFAPSSRFGLPDELKEMIDQCHRHGIRVFLDLVHSHACRNTEDGLNQFNGSDGCYFHDNERGHHLLWDSRLFDYSKWEVLRFLCSNLRYYLEEFHFDGFRFDGVTSMIYHDHGIDHGFSGTYNEYFGMHVDLDALNYLQLANFFLHHFYPSIVTIAEEVSGMPALCWPVEIGGIGFDYRLAMAIPDKWIKLLKEQKDEDWKMWDIVWTLTNRRYGEKHISYAESHDQALVGDKTIAFWLMDAEMYSNMSTLSDRNLCIDRGIALHKMIRLVTFSLGGEAYLNFMGNEFGHPEWLDFPRPGNNDSYHYARRQWSLVHDSLLRYRFLNEFDRFMIKLDADYDFLKYSHRYITVHEDDKIVYFERSNLLFIFNFNSFRSFEHYRIGINGMRTLKIVLNSDDKLFDGHDRIDMKIKYQSEEIEQRMHIYSFLIYLPSRTALVLTDCENTTAE